MRLTISTIAVCAKPNCNTRSKKNLRFRRRGEWEIMRNCPNLPEGLVQRYYEGRSEDSIVLCEGHYQEIRDICQRTSRRFRRWQARKTMPELTADEILQLIDLLESTCKEWENE